MEKIAETLKRSATNMGTASESVKQYADTASQGPMRTAREKPMRGSQGDPDDTHIRITAPFDSGAGATPPLSG